MSALNAIVALISRLPPEGLAALERLLAALLGADDPMRAVERAAAAAASERASEAAIKAGLRRRAKR